MKKHVLQGGSVKPVNIISASILMQHCFMNFNLFRVRANLIHLQELKSNSNQIHLNALEDGAKIFKKS